MVLIKPGIGAAVITFPSIEEVIYEILIRWYSEEKAKQYAANVQEFFEQNAEFPEDGFYKLEDEVFYRLDTEYNSWVKTKNTKTSYVINDKNVEFWQKFDEKIPYMEDYKAEIQQIIFNTTSAMFDVAMVKTSFVSRNVDGVSTVGVNEDSAIKAALCSYVNEQEREAYIAKILAVVFHSDTMPIFVIDKGITVSAITKDSISTDLDEKALQDLLNKSFSADDVQHLQVRIMNAIKYGVDSVEEVLVDENGDFVVNIGGLHVIPDKNAPGKGTIANDKNNIDLISSFLKGEVREVECYGGGHDLVLGNRFFRDITKEYKGKTCVAIVNFSNSRYTIFVGGLKVGEWHGGTDGIITFNNNSLDLNGARVTIKPVGDDEES